MKVLFIYPEYETLGIEYLSAVLKKGGHQTKLIFDPLLFNDNMLRIKFLGKLFSYEKRIIERAKSFNPDLIVFSILSDMYCWASSLAGLIKQEMGVPIVFGGIHTTTVPEVVIKNKNVDFVVVGEGEYALLELVNKLERKKSIYSIKNLWAKRNGRVIKNPARPLIKNLDKLPFPDKDLFYKEIPYYSNGIYTITTSRGCPYSCTYCCNNFLKKMYKDKKYLRRRSVENVMQELGLAKKKYGIKWVVFHDEIFTHDLEWLREFAKRYRVEIGLPFFCWVHPNTINEETVSLLKHAGCRHVQMGVQSMYESTRRNILNRHTPNENIKKAINLLMDANIFLTVDNIFGLPGQTKEELLDLARFYSQNKVDLIDIYWLRYYPKTDIIQKAKTSGALSKGQIKALEQGYDSNSFLLRGDTYDRELNMIRKLVFLTPLLPKKLTEFFIRKRAYRYLPPSSFLTNQLTMRIINKLFKHKRTYPGSKRRVGKYLYFGTRKIIRRW